MDIPTTAPSGGPGLRMPMQSAPVTRSRVRGALDPGAEGVEASSLFGFIKDLATGNIEHMVSSAAQDVGGWLTS